MFLTRKQIIIRRLKRIGEFVALVLSGALTAAVLMLIATI